MVAKSRLYYGLLATTSALAVIVSGGALHAQEASPSASQTAETVVVTGSRLRSGFSTPTPVTVAPSEQLKAAAPSNLADGLAQLPQFNGNNKTTVGIPSVAVGTTGQNLLNLRNLGFNRNLVLLDGRRIVASNQVGSVDVNVLPQALVSRVDTVTGGASAAYGSDAVSGVINFVLDKKFTGLKLDLSGGITNYNDAKAFNGSLVWGGRFLEDKLNVVSSFEIFKQDGIHVFDDSGRVWFEKAAGRIANPSSTGTPRFFIANDVRSSIGSYGGLIVSGPLRGLQFMPNGQVSNFDYGNPLGTTLQDGGSGPRVNVSLSPQQSRFNGFARAQYEISDNLSLNAMALFANSTTIQKAFVMPDTGGAAQFTIFRDNAFLPSAALQRMITANVQTIAVGRYHRDFPAVELNYDTDTMMASVGADGNINSVWKWDTSFSFSKTEQLAEEDNNTISRNLYAAVDAVRDLNGNIVCRSNLTGGNPGCVPLNIFGEGSPSAAAIDYVLGNSWKDLTLEQTVFEANLRGSLPQSLSLGAGPVSIATGIEIRKETANQISDALSQITNSFTGITGAPAAQNGRQGGYRFFNPQPYSGEFEVKEGYVEAGVPLLQDIPLAEDLSLSLAARYADYSTVGGQSTWKVGVNWTLNDDVRFRLTSSQDIRAPGLIDLYNGGQFSSSNVVYNGVTTPVFQLTRGNPSLTAETAKTLTYGVILKPSFIPGLQASVDYYKIDLENAIGNLLVQQQVNLCAAGDQTLCALQTFANGVLTVVTPPLNLNVQQVEGTDFEISYRRKLAGGNFSIRLLANNGQQDILIPKVGAPILQLGLPTSPEWRTSTQLRWQGERLTVFLQNRYISAAKIDPNFIEGTHIIENDIPSVSYYDATFTLKLADRGEAYVSVNNIFDVDPPVSPLPATTFSIPYNGAYDALGQFVTVGVRLKF